MDSNKNTSTNSLEKEAKEFKKRKLPPMKPKPMTSRVYLIGMAMNALLSRSQGTPRLEDIKRESEEIADYMLKD